MINEKWQIPPNYLTLKPMEIDLWCGDLNLPLTIIQSLKEYLSEEEIKRSERFKFDRHRNYYIASRGILRIILGKYLNIPPYDIQFQYSEKGKPTVILSQNHNNLEFNMSHSNGLSLYGIIQGYSIGIDVEYMREMSDIDMIAKRFFTAKECQIIQDLSDEEKLEIFFQLWTAKEAYLKCTGEGIASGLNKFEVEFKNKKAINLMGIDGSLKEISSWYFSSFPVKENYHGALVVNSQNKFRLNYFDPRILF
jgi:4'-phosphopantetheinyl transferase